MERGQCGALPVDPVLEFRRDLHRDPIEERAGVCSDSRLRFVPACQLLELERIDRTGVEKRDGRFAIASGPALDPALRGR